MQSTCPHERVEKKLKLGEIKSKFNFWIPSQIIPDIVNKFLSALSNVLSTYPEELFGEQFFSRRSVFVFFSNWAKKTRLLAVKFQQSCRKCILRFQRNVLKETSLDRESLRLFFFKIEQKKLVFWRQKFSRVVVTAFYVSRGFFSRRK